MPAPLELLFDLTIQMLPSPPYFQFDSTWLFFTKRTNRKRVSTILLCIGSMVFMLLTV